MRVDIWDVQKAKEEPLEVGLPRGFDEHYDFGKTLGKGGFGLVRCEVSHLWPRMRWVGRGEGQGPAPGCHETSASPGSRSRLRQVPQTCAGPGPMRAGTSHAPQSVHRACHGAGIRLQEHPQATGHPKPVGRQAGCVPGQHQARDRHPHSPAWHAEVRGPCRVVGAGPCFPCAGVNVFLGVPVPAGPLRWACPGCDPDTSRSITPSNPHPPPPPNARTHSSVVTLMGAYEDDDNIHIVMEYCRGGELEHEVGKRPYSEQLVAGYMRSVLHTLAQCASNNILHRDIKPGNFMLLTEEPDSPLKAIDFGLAVFFDPKQLPRSDLGLEGTPWCVRACGDFVGGGGCMGQGKSTGKGTGDCSCSSIGTGSPCLGGSVGGVAAAWGAC